MVPSISKQRGLSSCSWWSCAIACFVSFLLGRNTSNPMPLFTSSFPSTVSDPPPLPCPVDIKKDTTTAAQYAETKCPVCNNAKNTEASLSTAPSLPQQLEDIFNSEWVADPKQVLQTVNSMCKVIMDHSLTPKGKNQLGIGLITFCYTHVLTYKRNYSYEWDTVNGTAMGYYTGTDLPPYQMDMFQYSAIHSTVASIPSKSIKMELETKGNTFYDSAGNYQMLDPKTEGGSRGSSGPRVLFWGCGSDTPLHVNLVEFLGGDITFIDNSKDFLHICKEWYPDIRLIKPTGTKSNHTNLIRKIAGQDGSALETDEIKDILTESQWMPDIAGVETEMPWDIIVIDGPAEALGRSQPLYMAKRLAQSYGPNHHTHIFLHDASRPDNCIIANAIMGHDPQVYLGNTLPRKGLKHWRVPGRNRKLPPTNAASAR